MEKIKRKTQTKRKLPLIKTLFVTMLATVALVAGGVSVAYGAVGGTPVHTKNVTDNQDGTYTISLDIVGESEKKPNNVNVIVIVDTSGSMNATRMSAAKNAVNNLANALYAYNTEENPDTVEMALVRFSTTESIAQAPTSSATTFRSAVNGLPNSGEGGTNWEGALQIANTVDFDDDDQTFVIFVSDGNPTFRYTEGNYPNHNNDYNWEYYRDYGVWGSGSDSGYGSATTIARCYEHAVDDAEALATKVTPANFFTIGAFGNVDRMEQLTDDAGSDSSTNYYSAQNTAALNQAISDILAKIEMAGFADAELDDGTTNQVETTSGEVAELLELVPNFKYYRSGGSYGTMQTWADAPAAKIVNGEVQWDLSSVGVLENGVKYTVTFDCYPSQTTYDIIAQLKNGDILYSELDSEIQKYIVDNGGGSYSLRTNTNAGIAWDDTRDDEGRQSSDYKNPDPVRTDAVPMLTVAKEWEGGTADVDELPLTVLMGNEDFHTAALSDDNGWSAEFYISVGLIKDGQVLSGAEGHDFSFAELDDSQYHWELEAPTVRPMLIDGGKNNDGKPNILVKVDEDHPLPSGATTYTIDGATYYIDTAASSLTATNHRRSNLNLTKVVTGEDAPADATFPFTLTVNNSKAPATEPQDDPDRNSDYWLWFSIYDTKAGATVTDATVTGSGVVGPNADGYYYAPNNTAISVDMKDGWNLRFINLPSETTYTFAEGTLADGFAFKSAELTTGTDTTFSGNQTTTGTIQETKTSYAVTYTNDYALTDLEITKVWDDANDQDGMRLTAEELAAKLTLSPAVEGKTPTVVDNEDGTYTITYVGLPRFNNGQEVEYTVTEAAIDGYETTGSPAKDHGTITNKHTPEVTTATVKKVWSDADDQDGKRPASLVVTLNDEDETTVTLNESNQWTATVTGLPKYADGVEIEYTWTEDETSLPEGYKLSGTSVSGTITTLTNSYTPEVTTATVKKVWNDANDQDGKRPTSLEVTLSNGTKVTLNAENEWTATVENLPKNSGGQPITYTWTEGDLPEGYSLTGTSVSGTITTLTNSYTPETTEATVKKVWNDDDDQDGIRPDALVVTLSNGATVTLSDENEWTQTITGLPKYADGKEITYTWTESGLPEGYELTDTSKQGTVTTLTNTHTPAETEATVIKVWEDADDQDGIRPQSLQVTLKAGENTVQTVTLNADNEWTQTITGLPKYADGKEITYTWTESGLPEGYELVSADVEGAVTTLTNEHVPAVINLDVTKVWVDNSNQDGKRPDSVEVTLLANDEPVTQTGITATVTLNEDNEWTYTWEGLNQYADGEEIAYTVEETKTEVITGTDGPGTYADDVEPQEGDDGEITGYLVTNTHTPEKTEATVKKVWDDADDQDGKRPADITVTLSNGDTVTLSESNEWKATKSDLPKYADGKEITYTWTESGLPEGYELSGTSKEGTVTTLTNTHTPEVIDITVTKTWDDADDKDGIRPESINAVLKGNGETVGTAVLNEGNGWTYTWTGLDKYAGGEEIGYTISEDPIPEGYTLEDGGDKTSGFTLKNIHTAKPDKVMSDPPVQKIVTGNPSKDETFTFQMKAVTEGAPMPEGSADGVKTVTITGTGSTEFGEMYYEEAGEWVYEISEVAGSAEGYTYDSTKYTLTVTVTEQKDGNQVKLIKTEKIEGGNGTIVFTNTYTEEEIPQTGDDLAGVIPPLGIVAAVSGLLVLGLGRKLRKQD